MMPLWCPFAKGFPANSAITPFVRGSPQGSSVGCQPVDKALKALAIQASRAGHVVVWNRMCCLFHSCSSHLPLSGIRSCLWYEQILHRWMQEWLSFHTPPWKLPFLGCFHLFHFTCLHLRTVRSPSCFFYWCFTSFYRFRSHRHHRSPNFQALSQMKALRQVHFHLDHHLVEVVGLGDRYHHHRPFLLLLLLRSGSQHTLSLLQRNSNFVRLPSSHTHCKLHQSIGSDLWTAASPLVLVDFEYTL